MAALDELLQFFESGGPAEQIFLYNVVGQFVGALLTPYVNLLANQMNQLTQSVPLSPGDLAGAVVKGYESEGDASAEARKSGLSPGDFHTLVQATGDAPAPEVLAEALRRGFIPHDSSDPDTPSYLGGIRQGLLKDVWADVIQRLSLQRPSPGDFLNALLEGQTDAATAKAEYEKSGGDPEFFQLMFDTNGSAPTPTEAFTMANRGVIPWDGQGPDATSFEQAFLEGPWRDKWEKPFRALAEYLPPPRTVTAMYKEGSLDSATATDLLIKQGLTPTLAAAYLTSGATQKVVKAKELALSTIEALYVDQAISPSDAATMIQSLGYNADEAQFLLTVQDLKRTESAVNRALTTIHTQYVDHRIDRATASNAIDTLGIASTQRDSLLQIWDLEVQTHVAVLTATQVRQAFTKNLIGQPEAQARLENMGYSSEDAALFLQL